MEWNRGECNDRTCRAEGPAPASGIQARQIIDFSAAYDVIDSTSHTKVGALKRKGWKSLFKDEWIVMDDKDAEIGLIKEDNVLLALIRRNLTNLIP